MTQPTAKPSNPIAAHPLTSAIIAILVIADIWFALDVPLYASATPKVGDFPFFYFYLLIYMPATGIVMWIVYLLQKRIHSAGGPSADADSGASEVAR